MSSHHSQPVFGVAYRPDLSSVQDRGHASTLQDTYYQQAQGPRMHGEYQTRPMVPPAHHNIYEFNSNRIMQGNGSSTYVHGNLSPHLSGYNAVQSQQNNSQFSFGSASRDHSQPRNTQSFTSFAASPITARSHQGTALDTSFAPYSTTAKPLVQETSIERELEDGEVSGGEGRRAIDGFEKGLVETSRASQEREPQTSSSRPIAVEAPRLKSNGARREVKSGDSVSSAQNLAHNLLRELSSFDINFQELIHEGLDPGTLQRLYRDVAMDVPSPPSLANRPHGLSELDVGSENEQVSIVSKSRAQQSADGIDISKQSPHDVGAEVQSIKDFSKKNIQATVIPGTATNESNVHSGSSAKNTTSSATHTTAASKISETKTLDRKEYIARMLAAKNSKLLSGSAVASVPPSVPTNSAIESKLVSQFPKVRSSSSVMVSQPNPSGLPASSDQVPKSNLDIIAKRKAQTELARQKMEALVAQKSSRRDGSNTANTERSRSHTPSGSATAMSPASPEKFASHHGPSKTTSVPAVLVPPRQTSYFSPVSQTPTFNLPGLFMAPEASVNGLSTLPIHTNADRLSDPQNLEISSETAVIPGTSTGSKKEAILFAATLPTTNKTENASSGPVDFGGRKRQKAVDFIDSPPTRIKRSLGQTAANACVIIDISEDETEDSDDSDRETDDRKAHPSEDNIPMLIKHGKPQGIEDIPSLSDFPMPSQPVQDSSLTPLLVSHTPNNFQEPKELKSKELQIDLMNRKIAELEQRIKTKQATSRHQSPGLPAQADMLQTSTSSASGNIKPSITTSHLTEREQDDSFIGGAEPPPGAAAPSKHIESATEEQLLAEKAQQENILAANEAEPQHSDDLCENEALNDNVTEKQNSESRGGGQDAEVVRDNCRSQEQRHTLTSERHKVRKLEIESGLPLLDAEMERTQKRLQSLKVLMAELETEYQQGVEGREALLSELLRLSQTAGTIESDSCSTTAEVEDSEVEQPTNFDKQDLTPRMLSDNYHDTHAQEKHQVPSLTDRSDPHSFPHRETDVQGDHKQGGSPDDVSTQVGVQSPNQLSDGELEDDMNILDSNRDNAKLNGDNSTYGQQKIISPMTDEEDIYEPPSDIALSREIDASPTKSQRQATPQSASCKTNVAPGTTSISDVSHLLTPAREDILINADSHNKLLNDNLSEKGSGGSEDGEYEPPEPASLTRSEGPLSRDHAAHSIAIEASSNGSLQEPASSHATTTQDSHAEGRNYSMHRRDGLFTPYESPLKQFKAYRYHPEFPSRVPRGYRSLTYFNAINPETPICRDEMHGSCIDPSCTYQHFASMELRGRPPGDVVRPQYDKDLTQLIRDLRTRRVKDFDTIAPEISRYRAIVSGKQHQM